MRRLLIVLAPCALAFAFAGACGRDRLPEPSYGEHPRAAAEAICVPYPPPAAKPEEPGASPSGRAVWVDGEWIWKSRGLPGSLAGKWEWKPGGWVEPPYGATYARSQLERLPNGALAWYPPHWHMPDHYKVTHDAAGPIASTGKALACPDPEKHQPIATASAQGDSGPEVHYGPAYVYGPDAPGPQPTVVADAVIPLDAKEPPKLIDPPAE